jgi:hypothetical protein
MTKAMQIALEAARKLTVQEREELAELLLESIAPSPDLDAAWHREAGVRLEEHRQSGEEAVDAFEAIEDARRQLRSRT